MSGDVGAVVAAIVAALNPTWHRGMYGCPDDMYAARDLRNQLAPIIAERVEAAKAEARPDNFAAEVLRDRARQAEATVRRVEALADSAGDLDNGILVWDLRKALDPEATP